MRDGVRRSQRARILQKKTEVKEGCRVNSYGSFRSWQGLWVLNVLGGPQGVLTRGANVRTNG